VSHWHTEVQVWTPPVPQGWVLVGAHTPSFTHVDQSDQTPLLHVRVWVPQLPQAWLAGPEQVWPMHGSHWHMALHAWVPPVPQAWVLVGVQTPSFTHVDQSDQTPLLHARVWIPQFPHA
jgi:hypothetical protein